MLAFVVVDRLSLLINVERQAATGGVPGRESRALPIDGWANCSFLCGAQLAY